MKDKGHPVILNVKGGFLVCDSEHPPKFYSDAGPFHTLPGWPPNYCEGHEFQQSDYKTPHIVTTYKRKARRRILLEWKCKLQYWLSKFMRL